MIEFYARGGPQKAGDRTAYYEQNVYSDRRPPPDSIPTEKGPAWIANLRPKWAEEKDSEKSKHQTFQEALDKVAPLVAVVAFGPQIPSPCRLP